MEYLRNLKPLPQGIDGILDAVAKLSMILGPDWHFNSEESHVSWRFRETEEFPVAVDFTDPVSVCTACGFWDTGLNPTQQWRQFEAASGEIGLA